MKIVYNKLIPLPSFKAMLFFGILFVREGSVLTEKNINHENIHEAQALDFCHVKFVGYIMFYLLYLCMWIVNLFIHPTSAYRDIPFEKEAYYYQGDPTYLKKRKPFAWNRHQFKS